MIRGMERLPSEERLELFSLEENACVRGMRDNYKIISGVCGERK